MNLYVYLNSSLVCIACICCINTCSRVQIFALFWKFSNRCQFKPVSTINCLLLSVVVRRGFSFSAVSPYLHTFVPIHHIWWGLFIMSFVLHWSIFHFMCPLLMICRWSCNNYQTVCPPPRKIFLAILRIKSQSFNFSLIKSVF
mgnify:CR=1 FL=1